MKPRIFHGNLVPQDFAQILIAHFNQGNLRAQQVGKADQLAVQVATRQRPTSGGQTALTISLTKVEDGVAVHLGKQSWLGVAASLGATALTAIRNPFNLIGRLDDLAQDVENLQLSEQIWDIIENVAASAGASFDLSERLRRMTCAYCGIANTVGEPRCIACGAPAGDTQPGTCPHCGYVVLAGESLCPNCSKSL